MLLQVYHTSTKNVGNHTGRSVPVTIPQRPSPTLFTAHASRTHIKADQTDFPVKPDNSSGPTHDSPSERPSRAKVTFRHQKAPKSIEDTKQREDHPSQAWTDSSPCSIRSGTGAKARRAASKPSPYPPRCSASWKKLKGIGSYSMTPCHAHRSHRSPTSIGSGSRSSG